MAPRIELKSLMEPFWASVCSCSRTYVVEKRAMRLSLYSSAPSPRFGTWNKGPITDAQQQTLCRRCNSYQSRAERIY
jgi:hypothetical protein